ncbi:MAG: helix-turn-helix domain-containing protein [Bacteroidetes bacterium]|nr:helix-turn-helix domain-containing protein [Bacteroidota bacterium]
MLVKKQLHKRTGQEKEKILLDIQRLGVVSGCRKHSISKSQYYDWLDRYNAHGLNGLEDRRGQNSDAQVKRLEKENRLLKEILAEKELESRLKDELLKKKIAQWDKGKKS